MVKVLVVAQLPPPYVGQPIMIEAMVRGRMPGVELIHLPMNLSTDVKQVGSFRWGKLLRLFPIILRIYWARLVHRPRILYFAPGGPNRVSMFRDLAILVPTRWLFEKTVFHFHAGGMSGLYERLPRWQRWLFRRAYYGADAAVRITALGPEDGKQLHAKREYIVPNGIEDPCSNDCRPRTELAIPDDRPLSILPLRILFVAMLRESKGLLVLIEACGRLVAGGVPFQLDVMGQFDSPDFEAQVRARIAELGIAEQVCFLGVRTGAEKFEIFAEADVFCMPTFYEAETFGIVFLEAMACGLPVVATQWRGIPTIIVEGETGYLVPIKDAEAVADRLARLAADAALRHRLGTAGRERFLREFTLARYVEGMRRVFLEVVGERVDEGSASETVAARNGAASSRPCHEAAEVSANAS